MSPDEAPPGRRVSGKVLPQCRVNGGKIGRPPGDRHDGPLELLVQPVEVDQVEPAHRNAIEKYRSHPIEEWRTAEQREDPIRGVGAVDRHGRAENPFHIVGRREDDADQGGPSGRPEEGAVVEPDDPEVRLGQGTGELFSAPNG